MQRRVSLACWDGQIRKQREKISQGGTARQRGPVIIRDFTGGSAEKSRRRGRGFRSSPMFDMASHGKRAHGGWGEKNPGPRKIQRREKEVRKFKNKEIPEDSLRSPDSQHGN